MTHINSLAHMLFLSLVTTESRRRWSCLFCKEGVELYAFSSYLRLSYAVLLRKESINKVVVLEVLANFVGVLIQDWIPSLVPPHDIIILIFSFTISVEPQCLKFTRKVSILLENWIPQILWNSFCWLELENETFLVNFKHYDVTKAGMLIFFQLHF